jgi:hypothetical protein
MPSHLDRLSAVEDRLVEAEVDLEELATSHDGVFAVTSHLATEVKRLGRQMVEREAEILALNDRLGILLSSRGELLGRLDELERWYRSTKPQEGRVE